MIPIYVLLAALCVYFTRTGQRNDFTVGYATLNRPHETFGQIVGLFERAMPGHFQLGTELSFIKLLQKLHDTIQADIAHP